MPLRIAVGQFNELTDEKLRFARQIGADGIQMNTPKLPGEERWEEADIRALDCPLFLSRSWIAAG